MTTASAGESYEDHFRAALNHIRRHSECRWTRGYISAILDHAQPDRAIRAKQIMDTMDPKAKIAIIKAIRTEFGLGLKEAKLMVDSYLDQGLLMFPEDN